MAEKWTSKISPGHHAYLIAGTPEDDLQSLLDFLKKEWEMEANGNPDFVIENFPTLYIENCHDIAKIALNKPLGKKPKIFILSFGFMTRESANALLKLFEEPTETIFFVLTPNPERLPKTLLSRFAVVRAQRIASNESRNLAERFVGMTVGDRFEFSKKFAADITAEKKTRADALGFVEALEEVLREKKSLVNNASLFKELEMCRSYIKDQSSSVKVLLDEAALALQSAR